MSSPAVQVSGGSLSNSQFTIHQNEDLGPTVYARLYTTGQLTLRQAFEGLRLTSGTPGVLIPARIAFGILGHVLSEEDNIELELGYEGNMDAWIASGCKPTGFHQLFVDNYHQYKDKQDVPV